MMKSTKYLDSFSYNSKGSLKLKFYNLKYYFISALNILFLSDVPLFSLSSSNKNFNYLFTSSMYLGSNLLFINLYRIYENI